MFFFSPNTKKKHRPAFGRTLYLYSHLFPHAHPHIRITSHGWHWTTVVFLSKNLCIRWTMAMTSSWLVDVDVVVIRLQVVFRWVVVDVLLAAGNALKEWFRLSSGRWLWSLLSCILDEHSTGVFSTWCVGTIGTVVGGVYR